MTPVKRRASRALDWRHAAASERRRRTTGPEAAKGRHRVGHGNNIHGPPSAADPPPGRLASQFPRAYHGDAVATVGGSTVLCGPIEAALANGMLAHSDETDDTHPPSQSHPGCAVVPAALAAGEKFGIDGTRFLRAVALGYDVGPRVTATLGRLQ